MFTKYSIAKLLLLGATAHTCAQAQTPLWFDTKAAVSESSNPDPAAPSAILTWIEANRIVMPNSSVTARKSSLPQTARVTDKPRDQETRAIPINDAPNEGLFPSHATKLALWQDESKRPERNEAEAEAVENQMGSPSDNVNTQSRNQEKFSTAAMVGPMPHAGRLFSMLEVQDRFQSYAEPVQNNRTRDLDSPSQSPYTMECYTYISPVFYHKPLYFEQPNLERYGQGTYRYLQPAASSIHFFGTIPLLPYKMLTQHPCEKHYTLGNQRPGNCNAVQKRVIIGQSYLGEVHEYWRPGSGY